MDYGSLKGMIYYLHELAHAVEPAVEGFTQEEVFKRMKAALDGYKNLIEKAEKRKAVLEEA